MSHYLIFDPAQHSLVPPLGYDPGDRIKIPSYMFISFICEKTRKVWFKNLWSWLCNWSLIKIDLLTPSQGRRVRGPKNCAVAHDIHVINSHTKFGWISEFTLFEIWGRSILKAIQAFLTVRVVLYIRCSGRAVVKDLNKINMLQWTT